jgi:hypothetical protein
MGILILNLQIIGNSGCPEKRDRLGFIFSGKWERTLP